MGPPSHTRSVVDRNVVMRRIYIYIYIYGDLLRQKCAKLPSWYCSCEFRRTTVRRRTASQRLHHVYMKSSRLIRKLSGEKHKRS